MHKFGKRVRLVLAMGLMTVPLSAASVAYACTGLATISSNPGSGSAGDAVTVEARGFAPHDPADARTSPVEIRMDSLDGPVIATASPSSAKSGGNFSARITVPNAEPGEHVLIATQNAADGRPAYGSPARTVFTVNSSPARAPAAAPAPASAAAPAAVGQPAAGSPQFSAPTARLLPVRRSTSRASITATLKRAVTRCKSKNNPKKATTRVGKRRVTARRATCIKQANTRARRARAAASSASSR